MKRKNRYTIGELSEISDIGAKTLRFYDEKGVLTPSERDNDNNYRYYAEKQILDALAIREMKRNGFHMTELKHIMKISNIDDCCENLKNKITEIEEESRMLAEKAKYARNTLDIIERSLSVIKEYEENDGFIVDESPAMTVLYTRYKSKFNANQLFWDRYIELHRMKENLGFTAVGTMCAIFYDNYFNQFFFEEGDLEVYLPIKEADVDHPAVKTRNPYLRAGKLFIGWYADMLDGYVALVKNIESKGYRIIGPSHEEYLLEFAYGFKKENYYTRISFPVEKT
jgi:DNA-binding transcriptional MerR regulator